MVWIRLLQEKVNPSPSLDNVVFAFSPKVSAVGEPPLSSPYDFPLPSTQKIHPPHLMFVLGSLHRGNINRPAKCSGLRQPYTVPRDRTKLLLDGSVKRKGNARIRSNWKEEPLPGKILVSGPGGLSEESQGAPLIQLKAPEQGTRDGLQPGPRTPATQAQSSCPAPFLASAANHPSFMQAPEKERWCIQPPPTGQDRTRSLLTDLILRHNELSVAGLAMLIANRIERLTASHSLREKHPRFRTLFWA